MSQMPIKRLKYFTGQFLEEADFSAEQKYHLDMRRRGNRAFYFGAGILDDGFQVAIKPGDATKIVIAPGIAVDGDGRELVALDSLEVPVPVPAPPMAASGVQAYRVALAYGEQEVDQQTADENVSENTRYVEQPKVGFFVEGAPIDGRDWIVIGSIDVTETGNATISTSAVPVRVHANARVFGSFGIGTTSPEAKLHVVGTGGYSIDLLVNGRLKSDNNDGGLWISSDRFVGGHDTDKLSLMTNNAWRLTVLKDGMVGIGTTTPVAQLQVVGGAIMPAAGNTEAAGILFPSDPGGGAYDKAWIRYYARDARAGTSDTAERTALELGVSNDKQNDLSNQDDILLMPSGAVGVGVRTPSARLSVVADGATEITGTAQSSTLKISAGSLGGAAGSELNLASFGFNSPNNNSLGIRAHRVADGADWNTVAIGLGIDVENTPRVNDASLWLHPAGRVGIGSAQPAENARLHVVGGALAISLDQSLVRADAAVHVSGGFGRLLQMNAMGASRDGLNLLASTNAASEHQWWSWGTTSTNTWRIKSGTDLGGDSGLTIDGDGKIGIGTTEPGALLEVAGGVLVAGNVTIGAGGNAHLKVRHVDGKADSSNDEDGDLYLNWDTNRPVHIGSTGADLKVSGALSVAGAATIGAGGNAHLKVRHVDGKADSSNDEDGDLYLNWDTNRAVHIGSTGADLKVSGALSVTGDAIVDGGMHIRGRFIGCSKDWGGSSDFLKSMELGAFVFVAFLPPPPTSLPPPPSGSPPPPIGALPPPPSVRKLCLFHKVSETEYVSYQLGESARFNF